MRLRISPRGTVWILTLAVLFLFCVRGSAHILEHYLKGYETLRQVTYIFWIDNNNDESIAAWYSSCLLLFCSLSTSGNCRKEKAI